MCTQIAVVIPVYNQTFALSMTLSGLERQCPPYNECPIWVIDDGSTEPIESVVEAYKDKVNIRYVKLEHCGRAAARNAGVEQLEGGAVIFCDADRIPRPGFIQAHANNFGSNGDGIVIGQIREMYVSNAVKRRHLVSENYLAEKNDRNPQYFQLVSNLLSKTGEMISNVPWIAAFSGNMSMPVQLYRTLGGFDANFNEWGFEHFEFGYRAFLQNVSYRYESEAVNVHIAHPRGKSYDQLIRSSHAYFYDKHRDPVIREFLDFMLGTISLAELEQIANRQHGPKAVNANHQSQYVKITNMQ